LPSQYAILRLMLLHQRTGTLSNAMTTNVSGR
jgi:hypothetical protein